MLRRHDVKFENIRFLKLRSNVTEGKMTISDSDKELIKTLYTEKQWAQEKYAENSLTTVWRKQQSSFGYTGLMRREMCSGKMEVGAHGQHERPKQFAEWRPWLLVPSGIQEQVIDQGALLKIYPSVVHLSSGYSDLI